MIPNEFRQTDNCRCRYKYEAEPNLDAKPAPEPEVPTAEATTTEAPFAKSSLSYKVLVGETFTLIEKSQTIEDVCGGIQDFIFQSAFEMRFVRRPWDVFNRPVISSAWNAAQAEGARYRDWTSSRHAPTISRASKWVSASAKQNAELDKKFEIFYVDSKGPMRTPTHFSPGGAHPLSETTEARKMHGIFQCVVVGTKHHIYPALVETVFCVGKARGSTFGTNMSTNASQRRPAAEPVLVENVGRLRITECTVERLADGYMHLRASKFHRSHIIDPVEVIVEFFGKQEIRSHGKIRVALDLVTSRVLHEGFLGPDAFVSNWAPDVGPPVPLKSKKASAPDGQAESSEAHDSKAASVAAPPADKQAVATSASSSVAAAKHDSAKAGLKKDEKKDEKKGSAGKAAEPKGVSHKAFVKRACGRKSIQDAMSSILDHHAKNGYRFTDKAGHMVNATHASCPMFKNKLSKAVNKDTFIGLLPALFEDKYLSGAVTIGYHWLSNVRSTLVCFYYLLEPTNIPT